MLGFIPSQPLSLSAAEGLFWTGCGIVTSVTKTSRCLS